MRDYGKVFATFWTSDTTSSLSDDGKMLALYLMTSPHTNALGCFRLTDGYVTDDMHWAPERVREGFAELFRKGFANRCETSGWVLIQKHMAWNRPENPNQVKAIARLALQVPSNFQFCNELKTALEQHVDTEDADAKKALTEAKRKLGSATVPKPFLNQKQKQEHLQAQEQDSSAPAKADAPTNATWFAYADAYERRHGAPPPRSAQANGIIARLLKKIPAADCPGVAANYVSDNSALYVGGRHPLELLLRDAVKLHTNWITGRTISGNQARQQERTSDNPFARMVGQQEALSHGK